MLDKTYQPAAIEGLTYRLWEEAGAFAAGRPDRAGARPYAIVIPPPNVTGSLHMGHAFNNTLQDILVRFERMRGRDVLWQPGTDHAGIATQMVVERQLMERQEPNRRDLGRDEFVRRVWQWKVELGGLIINQLKRLGASCDWSRERFTMGQSGAPDDQMVRAVTKVFVELYRAGLIYKDKRLVNWDPKLLTAISDLEVEQVEVKGHLWHLRYPLEGRAFDPDDASTYIVVATTRPETMLGDTAVAVHPDDERYKPLVGKHVILPLVGRRIPIIADEYSDPEKGSGAVKITPAHDFNDFEVGRRHALPMINVLSPEGELLLQGNPDFTQGVDPSAELEQTIRELHGLDRFVARKKIVERLEEGGLVEKIEPYVYTVPHGDRSNVVIEPFLTDQWYVDAKTLAKPAIDAVKRGRTVFVPKNWENTYFHWMENIQPWCISRQLWWGHQIPAWYGPDAEIFVAEDEAQAAALAKKHYGKGAGAHPRRRCARHLVLLGTVAVLHPRLARRDEGGKALLPDRRPRHRLRHHLLLGRPHDDDGPARHGRSAVPRRLHPCAGPRREGPEDVEVERQRHRPSRADRRVRRRRAPLHPRPWPRRAATSSSALRASRAIAISRPSCGTRRASPRSTPACRSRTSIRPRRRKRSTDGSRARASGRLPPSPRRSKPIASTEAAGAVYCLHRHKFCDWNLQR